MIRVIWLMFVPIIFESCTKSPVGDVNEFKIDKNTVLVVNPDADPLEKLASQEFNYYLSKFSNLELPISQESSDPLNTPSVLIGVADSNRHIQRLISEGVVNFDANDTGIYGYKLQTLRQNRNDIIVITGSTSKGVLNGVYAFMEELIKKYTGLASVDISYSLTIESDDLTIPELNVTSKPYTELTGLEWEGMALDNSTLIDSAKRARAFNYWSDFITWGRRHKMNTITNWPYFAGKSSMNNFPDIVLSAKYPNISLYTEDEIRLGIGERKAFLRYANEQSMDPYLMIYLPGWASPAIKENYPSLVGELMDGRFPESQKRGALPYAWSNPETHEFMAELCREVVRTYPEIRGLHFRVWGAESLPDAASMENKTPLIREMTKKMIDAVYAINPNLNIIISGYRNYEDDDFSYVNSLAGNIIIQRKWHTDWDVIPDAKIPESWVSQESIGVKKMVSVSVPQEEALPFWFPSARLFQKGLEKYIKSGQDAFHGFPINPRNWVVGRSENDLNYISICKLSWDPYEFDYRTFYQDFYTNLYGKENAQILYAYAEMNMDIMEDFLRDYAGIIDGMGVGNWMRIYRFTSDANGFQLFLDKKEDPKKNLRTLSRLDTLINQQMEASTLLEGVRTNLSSNEYFNNTYFLSKVWLKLFESRKTMIEIVRSDPSDKAVLDSLSNRLKSQNEALLKNLQKMTDLSCEERGNTIEEKKRQFQKSLEKEVEDAQAYIQSLR